MLDVISVNQDWIFVKLKPEPNGGSKLGMEGADLARKNETWQDVKPTLLKPSYGWMDESETQTSGEYAEQKNKTHNRTALDWKEMQCKPDQEPRPDQTGKIETQTRCKNPDKICFENWVGLEWKKETQSTRKHP